MYSWVTCTGKSWTGSGVDGGDDEVEDEEEKLSGDDRLGTDTGGERRSGLGLELVLLAGTGAYIERGSSEPDFVC